MSTNLFEPLRKSRFILRVLNEVNHDDGRYDVWNDVGYGLVWLLAIIVLILAAAALIKYLRS